MNLSEAREFLKNLWREHDKNPSAFIKVGGCSFGCCEDFRINRKHPEYETIKDAATVFYGLDNVNEDRDELSFGL